MRVKNAQRKNMSRRIYLECIYLNCFLMFMTLCLLHCVKSVRIRSFSGSHYYPAFGLNTERYGVSLRIQSECGKMRTRITPNMDTFHAVTYVLHTAIISIMKQLLNHFTSKLHYFNGLLKNFTFYEEMIEFQNLIQYWVCLELCPRPKFFYRNRVKDCLRTVYCHILPICRNILTRYKSTHIVNYFTLSIFWRKL